MVIPLIIILGLLGLCQGRTPQCQLRLSCELTKILAEKHSEGEGGLSCEDVTDPGQCSSVTQRELQEAAVYLGVAQGIAAGNFRSLSTCHTLLW